MKTLADRVNERMEALKLTQEDVAKMVGISQAAIWKITSGETTNPRCIVKLGNNTFNIFYCFHNSPKVNKPAQCGFFIA